MDDYVAVFAVAHCVQITEDKAAKARALSSEKTEAETELTAAREKVLSAREDRAALEEELRRKEVSSFHKLYSRHTS